MNLTKRTILVIISTFIALFFILAVTSDVILLNSFTQLERVVVSDNIKKVKNEIEESYEELIAASKEMSELISAQNNFSLHKISASTLKSRHVDLIICLSDTNKSISSLTVTDITPKTRIKQNHPSENLSAKIPAIKETTGHVSGLIFLEDKPVQVVLSGIKDSHSKLLVGRFLDTNEINRVKKLTEFAIQLVPVVSENNTSDINYALNAISKGEKSPVLANDNNTVCGYSLLKDLFDHPALLIKITEERVLYNQGKASIIYVLVALGVCATVFCCVMLLFIRGTILNRLASLNQKVSNVSMDGDISARLPVSNHQDELKDLAVSINGMLDSLENSEKHLRESEERYRTLFERAPDSIIIIGLEGDEAGRIVSANQAAADQHGYTLAEILDLSIFDLNTAETNKIAGDLIASILTGEWVVTELWHQRKDGTQFPLEVHAGLILIAGKKYILGFDRDITQRKITEETGNMYLQQIHQLNDELSQKAIDLAALNNELETFNYSVSHDMRGPLTRISGYCQLMLDDCNLEPTAKNYINKIYESETWLNDMIDALLQLAHLTRVEITADSVSLSAIAEEVSRELSFESPDKTAVFHIAPDVVVSGDSRLLKMVMTNLLNNACKYSSRVSKPVIEFGVEERESEKVYFVRDNGTGFDMKDSDKLFRVFTRLHDASQYSGTGIGLATVKRIILRHGGKIWADAKPGFGATFFFTLP